MLWLKQWWKRQRIKEIEQYNNRLDLAVENSKATDNRGLLHAILMDFNFVMRVSFDSGGLSDAMVWVTLSDGYEVTGRGMFSDGAYRDAISKVAERMRKEPTDA